MDIDKAIEMLHPLERKVQPHLADSTLVSELIEKTGLQEVEVIRALQWLENKGLLKMEKEIKETVILTDSGNKYSEEGLPEKRFIYSLQKKEKCTKEELQESANLSDNEFSISLGSLKRKNAIVLKKEEDKLVICITDSGKELSKKDSLETLFLKVLKTSHPQIKELKEEQKFAFDELNKRNIVDTHKATIFWFSLTAEGERLSKIEINEEDIVDNLTPEIIKSGGWKDKKLRRYDVEINVPSISGGKTHFVKQALRYGKNIWKDLGFTEMTGSLVQTSFWNFDALFTAQDHPVRDMQDTYFIKNPKEGKLPDKKIVAAVKKSHEGSKKIKSKGWQYEWKEKFAKTNVLRTHTTPLSVQTISKLKKEDLPVKIFAVGRCFRNETVDWSHLFEFNQSEGIVVDKDANFKHLLGYLKQFLESMGYPKARFRPAHFPYTEPSVEFDAYDPVHEEWVELGGAGIFRPEVVVPLLGDDVPVLAWGPGIDRLIPKYFEITDLRELYKNDIKQLKEIKTWLK
jgi:phenylalanyl-tRNA synthetase alpha chain